MFRQEIRKNIISWKSKICLLTWYTLYDHSVPVISNQQIAGHDDQHTGVHYKRVVRASSITEHPPATSLTTNHKHFTINNLQ